FQAVLGVRAGPAVDRVALVVDDGDRVGGVAPVPSDMHVRTPDLSKEHHSMEVNCRKLTARPSRGHVPDADQMASARRGWQNSCWPSSGSHYRPCTHRDRVVTTLPKKAALRMVPLRALRRP